MVSLRRTSKIIPLSEAVAMVHSGDVLGVGGMTLYRKPMAFIRELIRSGTGDLTLLTFTSSIEAELLALAGKLRAIRTCYMGLEFLGLAPALRYATQRGDIAIVEETEFTISYGLQASLMHVPYLPGRDCEVGTDYFRIRHDLKRAPCPITGEELTWFPAVSPRVALIHAPMADERGNVWLGGQYCLDAQMAMAAETVIVTTERIASTAEIREAQGSADVVSFMVHAVVEAPGGAHPTSCYPNYPTDVVHIANYLKESRSSGSLSYLNRFVLLPLSLQEYLLRVTEEHDAAS